jgi:leader peptidase (prepilin peptidase)/N-methyltransferase
LQLRKLRAAGPLGTQGGFATNMALDFATWPPEALAGTFLVLGAITGGVANLWAIALTSTPGQTLPHVNGLGSESLGAGLTRRHNRFDGTRIGFCGFIVALATGLLFAAYVLAAVRLHCQDVPEVRPDDSWKTVRIIFHLGLISLLVVATLTDLRKYAIPDQITLGGLLVGILVATLSGQLQMEHVWVDWNQEVPGIRGPYIPDWLDAHRHWHGFAWSVTGALVGAGLTWFVRAMSGLILGREALGSGDITLMAMIGAFVGWQPVVVVFVLAPICGILCTVPLRLVTKKAYLPYGPFLAAATIVVLFSWKWIWQWSRLVFGHPQSLALLGGAAAGGLIVLLLLLRIWQARFGEPGPPEIRFED